MYKYSSGSNNLNITFTDSPQTQQISASAPRRELAHKKQHTRASYDVSKTTPENKRYWQNASPYGLTPDQRNNAAVRHTLKQRSRYEYDNGGYTKRIINKTANEVVGRYIKINIESDNAEFNEACEKSLNEWQRAIKLERKLRTLVRDKMRDGEALALPYTNIKSKHAIQLDLACLSCDRLTSPTLDSATADQNVDGVILDDMGINVVKYQITKYSGTYHTFLNNEFTEYPEDQVLFWYEQEYSEQHRGIPELTSTLDINAARRAYSKSVLSTAQMQSNFAIVFEQQVVNAEEDPIEDYTEMDLERNIATFLPPGTTAKTLDASQPIDTFKDYDDKMLQELGASSNLPHNIVKGSSAEMSYAGARFDYNIMFVKDRNILRADMNLIILEPLVFAYIEEWAALNYKEFPMGVPQGATLSFGYEADKSIDPQKTAKANQILTDKNEGGRALLSAKDFYSSEGKDWREEIRQQAIEDKYQEEVELEIFGEKRSNTEEPTNDEQ